MILAKTPYRVSLFGGGTDYPAHYNAHGGAVLGLAIDKYCWVFVRRLPPYFADYRFRIVYSRTELVSRVDEIQHPAVREVLRFNEWPDDQGLEIHHAGDLPALSGMGSSSAFTVGLLNAMAALQGRRLSAHKLAIFALHVEQTMICENVGSQDQVWAAYGGLNRIDFLNGGGEFAVRPLILPEARRREFLSSLSLFFTGLSRNSSEVSARQMQRVQANTGILNAMKAQVDQAAELLLSDVPLSALGKLLDQAWACKRCLSSDVSTPAIDALYQAGLDAGAWGGKLLGAGSGGFLLFMVPPERRAALQLAMNGGKTLEELEELGELPRPEINVEVGDGSKIVVYSPNGL